MPAAAGSYAVTGATAAFVTTAPMTAGSYNLTGSAATLTATSGTTLAADAGSYAVTGSSVALLLSPGYLITGSTAVFKTVMPADESISGDTLSPTSAFFITTAPATAGSYSLTGSAVTFTTTGSVTMVASPGSYAVTGSDVTFLGGVAPPPDVTAPSPGGAGAGRRYGRYGKFRLKKKYRDELEELFDRIADLPPPRGGSGAAHPAHHHRPAFPPCSMVWRRQSLQRCSVLRRPRRGRRRGRAAARIALSLKTGVALSYRRRYSRALMRRLPRAIRIVRAISDGFVLTTTQ